MATVDYELLRELGACQSRRFLKEFPEGIPLNRSGIVKAVIAGFDVLWFSDALRVRRPDLWTGPLDRLTELGIE